MASEAIQKILAAEAESNKKNAEARKRRDELIENALGNSSVTIQKKIGEANRESQRIRSDYDIKLEAYRNNAEAQFEKDMEKLKRAADANMDRAVDEIIASFF